MFVMFYYLVMLDAPCSEYIFPEWQSTVSFGKKGTKSTVSDKFRNTWSKIYRIAKEYCDNAKSSEVIDNSIELHGLKKMAPKRGAHCGKKYGIQTIGDSNLCPQDIIGRAGWVVKNFHTFFDYWVCTHESMVKSGRAIYDWPVDDGGIPPTMDSIKTSREKINPFVSNLLGRHVRVNEEVKYMLVANGLRFYNNFREILANEPLGTYEKDVSSKHKFCNQVRTTYYICL